MRQGAAGNGILYRYSGAQTCVGESEMV